MKKYNVFFQQTIPLQLWRIPLKSKKCSIRFWKNEFFFHMISLQVGNIPVPYVACFSIYSHPFNMQNSCQKCNTQCIHYSPWTSRQMTMLPTHGKYPTIRRYSTLFKKPCSCKSKNNCRHTCSIHVEKVQSSFVVP